MQWSMKEKTAAGLGLADLILLIVLSYRNGSGFIETGLIDRLGWSGTHAAQI